MSLGVEIRYPNEEERDSSDAILERARWKGREHLRQIDRTEAEALWRDLRRGMIRLVEGIHIPLPVVRELDALPRLSHVEFRSVNIPLEARGGRFSKAEWRDCQFVDVVVDAWRLSNAEVLNCRFERLDSGRAYVGGARDATFADCEFVQCRFRETNFTNVAFRRTRFVEMRGSRVHWADCTFDHVVASGRVDAAHLLRCDFRATDFSALHLVEGTLRDGRIADVDLPTFDDAHTLPSGALAWAFDEELPTMSERSRDGVARLKAEGAFDVPLNDHRPGDFWDAGTIASIFDIERADADRIVERLRPHRLRRLPA